MQDHFFALADTLTAQLKGDEGYLARFSGESSDFVRFNRSAVRQAGAVEQRYLTLELFRGKRHASQTLALSGDAAVDRAAAQHAVTTLRHILADTSEDPHFLINTTPQSTTRNMPGAVALPDEGVDAVLKAFTPPAPCIMALPTALVSAIGIRSRPSTSISAFICAPTKP